MAFLILLLATGYVIRPPVYSSLYLIGTLFLGYVTITNCVWFGIYPDALLLLSPIYYVFNFGVFLVVLSMLHTYGTRMVAITRLGLAVSVSVELVACMLVPGGAIREIGTFNNPNQLGYWSVLTLACWFILKGDERLGTRDFLLICATGFLVMLSVSRAALLAFGGLVLVTIIAQGIQPMLRWSLGVLLVLVVIVLAVDPSLREGLVAESPIAILSDRLADESRPADSVGGRGYDRLWLYPQYLIFGAGEGAYERFALSKYTDEIHSSFGAILFSYGLVGFFLFAFLLYWIFRTLPIRYVAYFVPICLYGLTHQGLRSTLFWVFLALAFGAGEIKRNHRNQHNVLGPSGDGRSLGVWPQLELSQTSRGRAGSVQRDVRAREGKEPR